jgi:hypothetical protein
MLPNQDNHYYVMITEVCDMLGKVTRMLSVISRSKASGKPLEVSVADAARDHYASTPGQTKGAEYGRKTGIFFARVIGKVEDCTSAALKSLQARYRGANDRIAQQCDIRLYEIFRAAIAEHGVEGNTSLEYTRGGLDVRLENRTDALIPTRLYHIFSLDNSEHVFAKFNGRFKPDELSASLDAYARVLVQDSSLLERSDRFAIRNTVEVASFGAVNHQCDYDKDGFDSFRCALSYERGGLRKSRRRSFQITYLHNLSAPQGLPAKDETGDMNGDENGG